MYAQQGNSYQYRVLSSRFFVLIRFENYFSEVSKLAKILYELCFQHVFTNYNNCFLKPCYKAFSDFQAAKSEQYSYFRVLSRTTVKLLNSSAIEQFQIRPLQNLAHVCSKTRDLVKDYFYSFLEAQFNKKKSFSSV